MTAPATYIDAVLVPYEGNTKFDRKTAPRIDAIARMRPLLDQANCTRDETILLNVAAECDAAGLHQLAEMYRRRAGVEQKAERDTRQELTRRAIEIIEKQQCVAPRELQRALGLTKRQYWAITVLIRKSNRVMMINRKYVPKDEVMF